MNFPSFFWVGFCAYSVVVMVGCCCGGEVEGVGLWGSAWWRSGFVDWHGGGLSLWIGVVEGVDLW